MPNVILTFKGNRDLFADYESPYVFAAQIGIESRGDLRKHFFHVCLSILDTLMLLHLALSSRLGPRYLPNELVFHAKYIAGISRAVCKKCRGLNKFIGTSGEHEGNYDAFIFIGYHLMPQLCFPSTTTLC